MATETFLAFPALIVVATEFEIQADSINECKCSYE